MNMAKKVLTHQLSEPLGDTKAAKVEINPGDGNLIIDGLTGGEPVLANGSLQYLENQDQPNLSVDTSNGLATYTLKSGGKCQPWLHLPWAVCNGATEWQVHLNPAIPMDLLARSSGGNVKVHLAGNVVNSLVADTGGGNMDLELPDRAANLNVTAKTGGGNVNIEIGQFTSGGNTVNARSGAGNVTVRMPNQLAARVHATSGVGKVTVDTRLNKVDRDIYQSPDYEETADRIEITVHSGAGNVSVTAR
jgi:hypothetical protein